jgi:hypothetical protein
MALKKIFAELSTQLDELFAAAEGLQRAAWDTPPNSAGHALIRIVGESADDVDGWLADARGAMGEALAATESPVDVVRALRGLVQAKEGYFRAVDVLGQLLAPERLEEIDDVGARDRDWGEWSAGVVDALARCREQNAGVVPVLFYCFEELAERASAGSVSVQTTSIGQQVTVPRDELAAEGVP